MAGKRGEITGLMWKWNYSLSDGVITSVCDRREGMLKGNFISQSLYSLCFTLCWNTYIYIELIMVGKVTEVFRAVICCMLLCFCLNCSTPNIKASPFCKGIFSSVALFLFFFCVSTSPWPVVLSGGVRRVRYLASGSGRRLGALVHMGGVQQDLWGRCILLHEALWQPSVSRQSKPQQAEHTHPGPAPQVCVCVNVHASAVWICVTSQWE